MALVHLCPSMCLSDVFAVWVHHCIVTQKQTFALSACPGQFVATAVVFGVTHSSPHVCVVQSKGLVSPTQMECPTVPLPALFCPGLSTILWLSKTHASKIVRAPT